MGLRILKDEATELQTVFANNLNKAKRSVSGPMKKMGVMFFLLAIFVLIIAGSGRAAEIREIAVISGKSFPADAMTLEEIKEIYRGERQLIGGKRLKPIDQRDTQSIRTQFLSKVLNFSGDEYVTYWNNRLFREGGIPPIPKDNSAEVIAAVQETDGAIGYVWLTDTTDSKANLKILLTIPIR
jgi:ABC-type phosphate transport system substrate-binding protein